MTLPVRPLFVLTFLSLNMATAGAWETDQLTGRGEPLQDVTEPANARVNALLDEAVTRTNERLPDDADADEVARVLAEQVHWVTADRQAVKGRGPFRGLGYGRLTAWLETAPDIDRRSFLDDTEIYAGIPFGRAPILASVGVCSTVSIGDVRMGTDKVDHFFDLGFKYLTVAARRGDHAAIDYGTRTERSYYGMQTSSAFSFGDLHANWQGWQFYLSLLDPDTGLFAWQDGQVVRLRDFDWRTWVDWRWDELLNPSVYVPRVQRWLTARIAEDPGHVCQGVDAWGDAVREAQTVATTEETPWAGAKAPPRTNPFGVPEVCGTGTAATGEAGAAMP